MTQDVSGGLELADEGLDVLLLITHHNFLTQLVDREVSVLDEFAAVADRRRIVSAARGDATTFY